METGRPTPFLARQLPALGWSDCSSLGKQKGTGEAHCFVSILFVAAKKTKEGAKMDVSSLRIFVFLAANVWYGPLPFSQSLRSCLSD